MGKVYPLEICKMFEAYNGEMLGWLSKGHHPKEEFVQAVLRIERKDRELLGDTSKIFFYCDEKELLEQTTFDQIYHRIVLSSDCDENGKRVYWPMESDPGRGAYPVTQLTFKEV
jgi:hypothetical protein